VVPAQSDPRAMTHSRKSAAQRAKSLERLRAFRAQAQAPATPTPQHSAAFDAAYSGPSITPEGASWDDRGYMVWRLPVRSAFNGPRRDNF
jgi:hypothetical protein